MFEEMNYLFGNAKRIDSIPDTFFHRRNSDLDYTGTMFRHENEEEENEEDEEDAERSKTKQKMMRLLKTTCSPPLRLKSGTPYTTKFTS